MTAAEKKAIQQRKAERAFRSRLMVAVHEKLPTKIGDAEVSMLAGYFLSILDYHRRKVVAKALGLGDDLNSGDSEREIKKHVAKLKTGDVVRFLLLCTVAGEVMLDSYQTPKALPPEHPLMQAAKLYKVDLGAMNFPESDLSDKQQELLRRGLCGFADAEKRWAALARKGATDADVLAQLKQELSDSGSASCDSGWVSHKGGASPAIWFKMNTDGPPALRGAELIAETRALFKIGPPAKNATKKPAPKKPAKKWKKR